MKKLLLIYLSVMAVIFTIPLFAVDRETAPVEEESEMPKTIAVYNADTDKVEEMEFEEYIKCVLPAEMPAEFHDEALKAQAVAARTYAYYKYLQNQESPEKIPPEHKGATVCTNSTHCEAFLSEEQLKATKGQEWIDKYYDKICSAVDNTKHEIMEWEEEPILAVFHSSSSAGRTESSKDVWGSELPYLVSVESTGEGNYDGFYSTVEVPDAEFKSKVAENFGITLSDDKSTWFGGVTESDGGAVRTIVIGGTEVEGTDVRTAFGLRSACFSVTDGGDKVVFNVEGFGHGVGMSQYGAESMAQEGANYSEILHRYYTGAVLVEK